MNRFSHLLVLIGLAALLCPATVLTQTTFKAHYGIPSTLDRGYDVVSASDGGFAILSITNNFGNGGYDIYLIRTNAVGDTLWTRTFGGTHNDYGYELKQTADGGYIICGSTFSDDATQSNMYLVKTGQDGNLSWEKTFATSSIEQCYSVSIDQDGGYILAGSTQDSPSGASSVKVLKADGSGNQVWEKVFTYSGNSSGKCIIPASGGGYLLSGGWNSVNLMLKLDGSGNLQVQDTMGLMSYSSFSALGAKIIQDTQGSYYMLGGNTSSDGYFEPALVKYTSAGNRIWAKTYQTSIFYYDPIGVDLAFAGDGGLFILDVPFYELMHTTVLKVDSSGALVNEFEVLYDGTTAVYAGALAPAQDGNLAITGYTTMNQGGADIFLVKTSVTGNNLFSETYGKEGPRDEDYCYSMQQTPDGGYVLLGEINSAVTFGDIHLIKLHPDGTIQWEKIFDLGESEDAWYVEVVPENGFMMMGYQNSVPFLAKADQAGQLLWSKTYPFAKGSVFGSVKKTNDNNFVFVCSKMVANKGQDVLLVKVNGNGDTLWTRNYGGTANEAGYDVVQTSDGGFLIGGYGPKISSRDMLLIKTDPEGNLVWLRMYGNEGMERATTVFEGTDGNFYGYGVRFANNEQEFDLDELIKVSPDGDSLALISYSIPGYAIYGNVARQTSDDGFILFNTITPPGPYSQRNIMLFKTDLSGEVQWTREIDYGTGEVVYAGVITTDGGFAIAGHATFNNSLDIFLVKTDSQGHLGIYAPGQITGDRILLYPNPSPGDVTVSFEQLLPSTGRITVFDQLMRPVKQLYSGGFRQGSNLFRWDGTSENGSALAPGMYFIVVSTGEKQLTGKVIME